MTHQHILKHLLIYGVKGNNDFMDEDVFLKKIEELFFIFFSF